MQQLSSITYSSETTHYNISRGPDGVTRIPSTYEFSFELFPDQLVQMLIWSANHYGDVFAIKTADEGGSFIPLSFRVYSEQAAQLVRQTFGGAA
ncbi:hypothetical protein AX777_05990 [Sphingobium yanoikuyae]|uniref:Uncharacterized protein n=1 Tax=Sphingobium yanoikuyae TaxID=13690 RepID=A0A177JNZ7_SPHYA|nr:hypothetical protein [Sphingobium yanoikuyae]OAH42788.1 hypothetical protein AX777_05990 [Sphingobium yanoikuyae]